MKRLFLALMLVMLPTSVLAETYEIDSAHSYVGFKVRHFFSQVRGEFTDFSGNISFDPAKPGDTQAELTIDTASIFTKNEKRDGHLKSEDFFHAEAHPKITFKSTSFKRMDDDSYQMEGLLTMRGVEKPVSLHVDFLGAGDAGGRMRAGFTAKGTVDRLDWGIEWNRKLDTGTLLGEHVEVVIEVEAMTPQAEEK